ncbi:hypothetical protein LCGC14_0793870 [marine sediment metagenome]|uniref:Peptidase M28 domain-containing protein n=1 Tax=marine sediment metagenome TaxID=412755 RepID=A0A0F9SBN7_9ZZZZ|nr:MAG: Aminopeptidase YwaD precursor [Candidatus Lokiarchaeum sp. GC14_75]
MEIEISKDDSEYMYNIIQNIIEECGPRMPCSPQEAKGAQMVKKELEQTCDEVNVERFTCHPRAALGWIKIDVFFIILSFSCFFLIQLFLETFLTLILAVIILGLNVFAYLVAIKEFFNYQEFIDPLFKKKESQNVIGKIHSEGEIKNLILFTGHIDSALQFNLLKLGILYPIISLLGFGILFLWIFVSGIFSILTITTFIFSLPVIYEFFFRIAIWFLIIGGIPLVTLLFFVSPGEKANKVPGAVDNLSAIAVVLGIGRYLKENRDIIPKNTEIRLIGLGCEEAFLRGAFRYVEAHEEELKKYNAVCINLEMIQDSKRNIVLDYEPTTKTRHSEEVIQKAIKSAESVGLTLKTSAMGGNSRLEKLFGKMTGGTDAAAFSKSNIKAVTIMATDFLKSIEYYHTYRDTLDKIEKGSLENVLKICISYLKNESKSFLGDKIVSL